MWRRPSSAFGTTTMKRSQSTALYHGKDMPQTTLGSFGPGAYDVKCSRTGTPRDRAKGGTPIFTGATGSQRESGSKRYEGKEWEATKRGTFGPGGYEPRTSNRGSPLWRRPSSAFGTTTMKRSQSATLYHGKDMPQTTLGSFGPGAYDVKCSRTGTPRDRAKGGTPIFTGATGSQRESGSKRYEGKEWEAAKRGTFGPGGYKLPPACGPQVLSTRTSGRSCTFGHADRDVFARLYRGSGGVIDAVVAGAA